MFGLDRTEGAPVVGNQQTPVLQWLEIRSKLDDVRQS